MLSEDGSTQSSLSGLSNNSKDPIIKPTGYLVKSIDTKDILQEHTQDEKQAIDTQGPPKQKIIKKVIDTAYHKSLGKQRRLDQLGGSDTMARKRRGNRVGKKVYRRRRRANKSSVSKRRPKRKVGAKKSRGRRTKRF